MVWVETSRELDRVARRKRRRERRGGGNERESEKRTWKTAKKGNCG
jgi:hypothetical protein